MKILILKPSSLGDVVQAMPVLRLIKLHRPESQVYWWIESGLAPLLEGDPDLAGVVRFDRRRWAAPDNWFRLWTDLRWMRAQQFDWVIDLQCLARSGAFAWLANGKLTVGLDEPREGARGYYDAVARRPSWHTHAADWYLEVLPLLGVPGARPFDWIPTRPEVARQLRLKYPVDGHPWIAFQPGARWPNKRWPIEHFAALAKAALERHPETRIAVLGAAEDRSLAGPILSAAGARALDLTGQLTLPEMVEWIRLSRAVVTNDTGPMHVAAALHRPVVAVFGPTEPRRTGPYRQLDGVLQSDLPCIPCMRPRCHYPEPIACLRRVEPRAALDLLGRRLTSPDYHPIDTPAAPAIILN